MKTILHLSADFPDALVQAKTRSVQNLIENTPGYRHVVYSLNRVNGRSDIASLDFGPDRIAVAYGAPPRGILLHTFLKRVGDWIKADLERRGIEFDTVHAHKFSVEGLVAVHLLKSSAHPLIVNIWGDTDLKIVSLRRDLRSSWLEIVGRSAAFIPCAPWAQRKFETMFGIAPEKSTILAPIVMNDSFEPSPSSGSKHFVTLFNLTSYRRKNLPSLIAAILQAAQNHPEIRLDIWGSGSPQAIAEIQALIARSSAGGRIVLKGPLNATSFRKTLQGYAGFLMPSRRETFGMVFVEALFCGLPILYSRNWGVDGFFESGTVGYACDPGSLEDILTGIDMLIAQEVSLKARLVELAAAGALRQFQRDRIVSDYRAVLERVGSPVA